MRRFERGSTVVELPMVLGFLIIPVAFLILTVPTWLQGIHAANDAAAESARAFVLSGGDPAAVERARDATAISHGFDPGQLPITSASPTAALATDVEVRVQVQLRAIALFDVGSFTFTASHVERYPTYVRTPR
ncbi:MAG: hypothetical protein HKN24_02930 [Acidimicrobiales bacterium]|nr:hypothetical protein [Acidimicrobiales bacterium]